MEYNINICVYISICILLILYLYINCNTNYKNNKNIIMLNIVIIFLLFLLFFNRNYNEYFNTVAPVTTVPVTTAPVTTAPVTTAPVTRAPVTTAPVTTAPVTTAPVTTALVTTAPPSLVKYGHLNKPISYKDIIYGKPIFYWESINVINSTNTIFNTFNLMGNSALNLIPKDHTEVEYNKRYILRFINTTITNSLPTDYIVFKLPINPLTHNTVFIQVRARNKWSNINMCICNNITKVPVKKILTLCNTINRSDWLCNSSLIGPYNNVALNAAGYYEWLSFPISYTDIQKYKDSENNIHISLNQGLTKSINYNTPNIEISGIATTSNPYGVYIIPVSNYQLKNFEILRISNNIKKIDLYNIQIDQWNDDQHLTIAVDNLIKINIPVIDNNCGIIIGFITHNNNWYDGNPTIYLNNNFSKKYNLQNLLVGRVGMSIIGRGLFRHPRGIYLSKTFVKNNVVMSNDNINYISLIIDTTDETNGFHIRAIYSEIVESNLENYIINPAPKQILYDFNNQPISYMENIYDEPLYYWEGLTPITDDLDITKRFSANNTISNINNTHYLNHWEKRTLFHFNNTSDTNLVPLNYILLKVPINPKTHNTIFLKVRARDRWTNINMFLCNKSKIPKNKILSICSINGANNTSNIGPFNNTALEGNYEWIPFPISKIYNTSEFVDNNEIFVSINKAIHGDSNIYIAGVAVCANPYAVTVLPAVNLHWNSNGPAPGLNWNNHNWNDDSIAQINTGQKFKIRIPILNNDKGIIIGIITHNATWYDSNPQIYFETSPDVFYMLSPLIIGKYGFANMNRGIYRASRGFFIPADVVIANVKTSFDSINFMYLDIMIDNSFEINNLHIRFIYTESVEPN